MGRTSLTPKCYKSRRLLLSLRKYDKVSHQVCMTDPFTFSTLLPAYPCGSCKLNVVDDAICCDGICDKWFHRSCIGMTVSKLLFYENDSDSKWFCERCLPLQISRYCPPSSSIPMICQYTGITPQKLICPKLNRTKVEFPKSEICINCDAKLERCSPVAYSDGCEISHNLDDCENIKLYCEHINESDTPIGINQMHSQDHEDRNNSVLSDVAAHASDKHHQLLLLDIDIKSFTPVNVLTNESIAVWKNRLYKCQDCNYTTHSAHVIKSHKKIHKLFKITCPYCSYIATSKDRLDDHISQIHGGIGRYECNTCHFKSRLKEELRVHIDSNCDAKPYKCEVCSYRCKRIDSLREHAAVTHTNNSRFKCNLCTFQCYRRSTWDRHKQTHTNLRPYQCVHCELTYKRKYQLTYHIKEKHN